jgi:hypothetical protein
MPEMGKIVLMGVEPQVSTLSRESSRMKVKCVVRIWLSCQGTSFVAIGSSQNPK